MRSLEVGRDHLVEAFFGRFQQVTPLSRGHAGIIDKQIEVRKALPRKIEKSLPVYAGREVALKVLASGSRAKLLRRVPAPTKSSDNLVSFGKLDGDRAANTAARAGNEAGRLDIEWHRHSVTD